MDGVSIFLGIMLLISITGILLLTTYICTGHLSDAKLLFAGIAWASLIVLPIAIGFKLSQRADTKTVVNTTSASVTGERSNIVDSGMTVTIDGVEYYLYQRGN